jgi:hypothetical protein
MERSLIKGEGFMSARIFDVLIWQRKRIKELGP